MNREREGRILIRLSGALARLNLSKVASFDPDVALVAGSSTSPLPGKRDAASRHRESPFRPTRRPLPACRAHKFSVSFSAVVIAFCSSIAIIQSKTAFQLGDVCSSSELSIIGNLSKLDLSLNAACGRLLLRESRFHVDSAGATFSSRFPGFPFLTLQSLKTNLSLNASIIL